MSDLKLNLNPNETLAICRTVSRRYVNYFKKFWRAKIWILANQRTSRLEKNLPIWKEKKARIYQRYIRMIFKIQNIVTVPYKFHDTSGDKININRKVRQGCVMICHQIYSSCKKQSQCMKIKYVYYLLTILLYCSNLRITNLSH